MSRAETAVLFIRTSLFVVILTVLVLTLGPFQHAETAFGLNDKEAHVIAFFVLTIMCQLALPSRRRTDMVIGLLALGGLIEVVQMFAGRSGSFGDWSADLLGVLGATLPSLIETLRIRLRGQYTQQRRSADVTIDLERLSN